MLKPYKTYDLLGMEQIGALLCQKFVHEFLTRRRVIKTRPFDSSEVIECS